MAASAPSSDEASTDERPARSRVSLLLERIFRSCDEDPKGSVHKAWGLALIFVFVYFIISVVEMINLHTFGGSKLMIFASIWSGVLHLALAVLGTFVLKRFPTSFAVGFFLGILTVFANQNLILFGVFRNHSFGNPKKNHAFANMSFVLFVVLTAFGLLLANFRKELVMAAVDVKGLGVGRRQTSAATTREDDDGYQYQDDRH